MSGIAQSGCMCTSTYTGLSNVLFQFVATMHIPESKLEDGQT